jgi:hypothetical protein
MFNPLSGKIIPGQKKSSQHGGLFYEPPFRLGEIKDTAVEPQVYAPLAAVFWMGYGHLWLL